MERHEKLKTFDDDDKFDSKWGDSVNIDAHTPKMSANLGHA